MPATASRTRRAATRRNAVEDSDDEITSLTKSQQDEPDELDEEVSQVSRRTTRSGRKSMAAVPSTRTTRTRTTRKVSAPVQKSQPMTDPEPETTEPVAADENVEPVKEEPDSESEPATQQEADPASPPSKQPAGKRRSATPRSSVTEVPNLAPATPKQPTSPAVPQHGGSPLADITANMNTRQPEATPGTIKPMKSMETFLDKPLDIVVKQRTTTIPLVEETAPKSRIVLTHLILNNFKSYAGRQEVGPFHASFSSVVGPNGSGKSNVIDSLLFVFGFRASKMRQGKLSALIHNSAEFPNLDYCEVAVHFEEVMDQVGSFLLDPVY